METGTVMIIILSAAFLLIGFLLSKVIRHERREERFRREFLDNEYNCKKQEAYDKTIDAEAYDVALTMLSDYCRCRRDWIAMFGEQTLADFRHIVTVPSLTMSITHYGYAISKYDRKETWYEEVWDNYRKLVMDYERLKNFSA